jgi:hypothetical protein
MGVFKVELQHASGSERDGQVGVCLEEAILSIPQSKRLQVPRKRDVNVGDLNGVVLDRV